MTAQRVRQTQVRGSDSADDTLPAGPTLAATETLAEDLDALRSQLRRILHGDAAGDWYDDLPLVDGVRQGLGTLSETQVRPYTHTQSVAATTWTVNHNLGYKPGVQVLTVGGVVVEAEIVHASDNQCLVYFVTPMVGSARCT